MFILKHLPDEVLSESKFIKIIANIFASIIILLVIATNWGKYPKLIDDSLQKKVWPQEAVKQLEHIATFNEYIWGGYLIFNDVPVYIDGRADVYQKNCEAFQDYIDIVSFKRDPAEILSKYQIEQVLIRIDTPLDIYLRKAGWVEKYRDNISVIYIKKKKLSV